MINEFREFVARGNLVDLAIAFIMGVAFAGVVSAFTDVVLGAASFAVGGDVSFDRLGVHRASALVIPYGAFLTAVANFVIVAFALFLVVKIYNRFRRQVETPPTGPTEVALLTEIRDELRKG
jgi:large conductance mechanosensitive channel